MGWFGSGGGGGNSTDASNNDASFGTTVDDTTGFDSSANMLGGSSGGSSNAMGDIQQFGLGLQQQLMVQTVITELCDRTFTKCCASTSSSAAAFRDGSLTGKEAACIASATSKWLDSNEYLMGRLQKKGQQAMQQHQQSNFG